ncbi:uncharacterized protein TrAtP1_012955 [Trichoderma atroviride]|uniref:uncharacterized protein n=1 Tax=Hypocrea atroviridis TaxID=63577 RepID=UPI003326854B|nr:hypothetical protein TrAtP1_012955 [Trichoderma atroviride]
MLITASAPHSAETPGPSQCRTRFDTPSPALSGLGRPDKIPKAPSRAPSARASTSTARQRRVESPRIASFRSFHTPLPTTVESDFSFPGVVSPADRKR